MHHWCKWCFKIKKYCHFFQHAPDVKSIHMSTCTVV
jgi:hypothetical protein